MTKIGFEFEFATPLDAKQVRTKLLEYGIKIMNNRGYKAWRLEGDMSIEGRKKNMAMFTNGHELVSPPMAPQKAFKMLDVVFKFMQDINAETNTTTGLHVNMDIGKQATKRIEPIKLVTLVDDEAVAKRYKRSKAYYALPLNSKIRKQVKYWDNLKNKPCKLVDYVKQWGLSPDELDEKYSTINFGKQKQGYLEFRMIGNRGYENRYKEIVKDIKHFETCMRKAADKNAGNKAMVRRLNKMAA
tara:strand:- start:493 stop:1221 length:729 start_codon:yes stop_codon:yes gene_type:complete